MTRLGVIDVRGVGDLREQIALLKREPVTDNGDAREQYSQVAVVRASRYDMSQRAFAASGAANYEQTVTFTIRSPRTFALVSGLVIELADGTRLRVAQITRDRPQRGYTELRAVGKGLEGYGIDG